MLGRLIVLSASMASVSLAAGEGLAQNKHYPVNRPPLRQTALVPLPLGAVKPAGWLKHQLSIQANGLTGHLDEFWPSLVDSAWKGGQGEAWERGPYYLDGLVPLAYVLDDPRLIEKTKPWIEGILASARPDGWFGPAKNKDRWPLAVAMKVLTQYHEATGDPRALAVVKDYFAYLANAAPDWPNSDWRGARAMENALSAYWLFRRTGDPKILDVVRSIHDNSFSWSNYFIEFPWTPEAIRRDTYPFKEVDKGMYAHVVNVAMGIKHPGVWFQQSGDDRDKQAVLAAWANLDKYHGQVGGRFSGDEHLSGKSPIQGTELCAIVEGMFSLENLIAVLGDGALSDRLELLAYNGLPGTCTPDLWAHQYDQQANQVLCTVAKRNWVTNGDTANLYGLEPNFGCCTANMHQSWPKLVSHLWMATHDQGLAPVAYGPSQVKAKVGDGVEITIAEETDYPFDGTVRFRITTPQPVAFPLHLRIPQWTSEATVQVGNETIQGKPGTIVVVNRKWQSGDEAVLTLPMPIRLETRDRNAVAIHRGPLVYSLWIEEQFDEVARHHATLPVIDWAVRPKTPWNYGLLLSREHPEQSITIAHTQQPGPQPFAHQDAPVALKVRGRALPDWTLVNNSAGPVPLSPVVSQEPLVDLKLIPYGCTRLRITEFPVLAE